MKKFRIMCLAAASAALAMTSTGCEEAEPNRPVPPEINQNDIVFEAKAGELTSEGATITVTHNGTDKETYYGFWYTDLETNATNAINRVVAEFQETGTDLGSVVTTGKTHITMVNGLDPMTTYRYVVFGLNEDGTIYGTPGSVDFTTLKGEVTFTVSVSNVTETTANATVTSTGDNTDTWYCFATTDLTSPLAQVVSAEVERLGSSVSSVLKDGNNMVQLSGLTAGTSYRAVVTGLKSDGTTYGTPVSASFRTRAEAVEGYELNPNWTATYEGRTTYQGQTVDVTQVISTDTERYFTAVYPVDMYDQYGIDAIAQAEIEGMADYYGPTWIEEYSYTESAQEMWNPFDAGYTYYVIVIGIDDSGNPSGLYQLSEPFEIEAGDTSEGYNQWIGNWRIEDASGNGYDLTIQEYAAGTSYLVSGWQHGIFSEDIPFLANYDASTGYLNFIFNENCGDVTITTQTGQEIECSIALFGIGNDDGIYNVDEIAAAYTQDGNTAMVQGYQYYTDAAHTQTVTMVSMEFFAMPKTGGNNVYPLREEEDLVPTFPLTMTKTSAQSSGVAAKAMRFEAKDYRLGTLRTTGTPHIVKSAK